MRGNIMKVFIKFCYLTVFIIFAIVTKPFRLLALYPQERFLQIAKAVGEKISSDRSIRLTSKIDSKVKELKSIIRSQEIFDGRNETVSTLKSEVNNLIKDLLEENTNNFMYRCLVRFT
jgi:hypothetical protein